jgi:predicted MFS family arabinose efflux permease
MGRAPDDSRGAFDQRLLVGSLTAAVFTNSTFWLSLGPFLPILAEDLNTSIGLLGQVPALLTLLAAAIGTVVGPLTERVGIRLVLLLGLLGVVLASLLIAIAPVYLLLLLAAVSGALSRAAVLPIAQAAAASFLGEQARWPAIARVTSGVSAAAIGGVPLMTSVASVLPWRLAFLGLAGFAGAMGLALWVVLGREAKRRTTVKPAGGALPASSVRLRQPPVLGLVGATLLSFTAHWTVFTYVGAYFVQLHGLGVREVGWIYSANGVALLLGILLAGRRVGSLPPRPLIMGSRVANGLLLGLALLLPIGALSSVALLAFGVLLLGLGSTATSALLADETPTGQATALALNVSAMNLGTALGASLGGALLVISGYAALGCWSTLCALGAGALVWQTRPRTTRLPPTSWPAPTG